MPEWSIGLCSGGDTCRKGLGGYDSSLGGAGNPAGTGAAAVGVEKGGSGELAEEDEAADFGGEGEGGGDVDDGEETARDRRRLGAIADEPDGQAGGAQGVVAGVRGKPGFFFRHSCARLTPMPDPEWVSLAARARCQLTVAGMEAVEVHSHLEYPTRDGGAQRWDLYGGAPGSAKEAVLLVHGGPIPGDLETTPADWGIFQSLARMLAASGLATVVFNHRFFSLEAASTAMNDIEDLLSHLRAERVCLWVFSGGGALLGRILRDTPASVRCVVAYYAPLHAKTSEFSAADAIEENNGRMPALLVARAGLDMPKLNKTIDRFIAVALRKNATIDVMNHPTGQHGFDCRDDNERTREILRRTVEFVRAHL